MLAAEALVQTDHPARYIAQLCEHASKMSGHLLGRRRGRGGGGPPQIRHAECSATSGIITQMMASVPAKPSPHSVGTVLPRKMPAMEPTCQAPQFGYSRPFR